MASVLMLILRQPCMLAAMSNLVLVAAVAAPVLAPVKASLVNLSLMLLSCISGGRMMWTSGSRVWGSWRPETVSGASTRTGTSWVMMVSLWLPKWSLNMGSSLRFPPAGNAECELVAEVVEMVRASKGILSFLVSRIWAEVAFSADLRARFSGPRGTSRLMTLLAADWTAYVSKMVSLARKG